MTWIFPVMYIFSGVSFPFAVLVYWLTNNVANLARSIWQIRTFPTPGSPAAEEKAVRDHENENKRRAREGQISLEEEQLIQAKKEAEERSTQGYQRKQPVRKRRKKQCVVFNVANVSRGTFATLATINEYRTCSSYGFSHRMNAVKLFMH